MIENFKLRVFRVVADTLNFSKAAEELHLTQPAVTLQIKALEDDLGVRLFDRAAIECLQKSFPTEPHMINIVGNEAVIIAGLKPLSVKQLKAVDFDAKETR